MNKLTCVVSVVLCVVLLCPAMGQEAGEVAGLHGTYQPLAPLRPISDLLGMARSWDPATESFRLQGGGGELTFRLGMPDAVWMGADGVRKEGVLRDVPRFVGRQLYVPVADLFALAPGGCKLVEQTTRLTRYDLGGKAVTVRTLQEADAKAIQKAKGSTVKLTTVRGEIILELFDDKTPVTVGSFLELVGRGYYDGLTFHRVIADFMVQGGDPSGDGSGGPGFTIPDEADKGLKHERGSLSMAKTAAPDTGGSQFFIATVPCAHLDGVHTVFGRALTGMDVVDGIRQGDRIKTAVILKKSEQADAAITAALAARVPEKEEE